MTIINESGLYSAIIGSRKPEAKMFKRWVTKTVLPSIRKHGAYLMGQEALPEALQADLAAASACLLGKAMGFAEGGAA